MSEKKIRVGIVGFGTVGCGVAKILFDQKETIQQKTGADLELAKIVDLDITTPRSVDVPEELLSTDINDIAGDDSIDIAVVLVGGTTAAKDIQIKMLQSGKNVVTANKALLAKHGAELFSVARENNVCIAFEASCAGGIPIISAIRSGLAANDIERIYGILNGTSNYILTCMEQNGDDFPAVLERAQELGYAEADPTLDINGGDCGHKLAILASLCFGCEFEFSDVTYEGIEKIAITDIECGREMGYSLKLLGVAEKQPCGEYTLQVSPSFVPSDEIIAQVPGPFNAVSLFGSCVGHTMYYGRGAGMMPTASAVTADIIEIVSGNSKHLFDNLKLKPRVETKPLVADIKDQQKRFYIRIQAKDEPGVLAKMSSALGENGISIRGALQQEAPAQKNYVTVVITTHKTSRNMIDDALNKIDEMNIIAGEPVCIQIVEIPGDEG
ncbi:homoserine dehydrogenase [Sedimentisphaera salicampi]|uniref:homoserine dehydrogenase n=1 Tax=Sedimentisphaera salicampi TaxID=1941349 RepID=UPI000B9B9678|nr:homoserine dehydrogenase [Sedimentisphaera salicampi]OXU14747.1 Homoserine dehydrogenase [Sedimentisphaera salicampi]